MEKIVEQGLLYDFYGELLTEHQKRIYEEAVYQDMSLSEIAEDNGISRQGVHDLLRRCDKILADYENTLHLVEKYKNIRKRAQEIRTLCGAVLTDSGAGTCADDGKAKEDGAPAEAGGAEKCARRIKAYEAARQIDGLAGEILEEL